MSCYNEYEDYYEPYIMDEIFEKIKQELELGINKDIKAKMEYIKSENKRLKKENDEYRARERDIHNREVMVKSREEQDIRKLYKSKWSEALAPLVDNVKAWRIGVKDIKRKKCNKCDKDRKIVYTSEYGDIIKKNCKCDSYYVRYVPDDITLEEINLSKYRDSWGSNFKFTFTPKYESKDYDESYCKLEFRRYMDKFDLEEIKELSDYYLRCNVVWTNREACKQCCDYLNNKKENEDEYRTEVKAKRRN